MKQLRTVRYLVAALAALALVVGLCPGPVLAQAPAATRLKVYKIAATATNTTTTFPNDTVSVSVYNAGANEAYVQIGAAATTASNEIPSGLTVNLGAFRASSVGVICDTAETATVYLLVTLQ